MSKHMNFQLSLKTRSSILLISIFLEILFSTFAVNATEKTVKLLPHWQKGEKIRYQKIKSRQKKQEGVVAVENKSITDLDIEVLSDNPDYYVLALTYGEAKLDDPIKAKNPLIRKISNLFKGYQIVIELDRNGKNLNVRNWKEVKEVATKMINALADEMKAAGVSQADVSKILDPVAGMYSTKQQVEQFCVQDVQLLFFTLGIELNVNKPFEFENNLPNPFGGDPILSRATLLLKGIEKNNGLAKIDFSQILDQESIERMLDKISKDLSRNLDKPAPDPAIFKSLIVEDSAEFNLEISSGWIQYLRHRRFTKIANTSQEDIVTITREKQ